MRLSDEEVVFEKTLKAYISLINTSSQSDTEFDFIEQLVDLLSSLKKYSYNILK